MKRCQAGDPWHLLSSSPLDGAALCRHLSAGRRQRSLANMIHVGVCESPGGAFPNHSYFIISANAPWWRYTETYSHFCMGLMRITRLRCWRGLWDNGGIHGRQTPSGTGQAGRQLLICLIGSARQGGMLSDGIPSHQLTDLLLALTATSRCVVAQ